MKGWLKCVCVFFFVAEWAATAVRLGIGCNNWLDFMSNLLFQNALPFLGPAPRVCLSARAPPKDRQTDRQMNARTHMENDQYLFELKGGVGGGGIIVLTQLALRNWSKSMPAGFMCSERPVDTAELNTQHTHKNKTPNQVYPHKHTRSVECRHTKLPWAP